MEWKRKKLVSVVFALKTDPNDFGLSFASAEVYWNENFIYFCAVVYYCASVSLTAVPYGRVVDAY